ncbi:MAG: hypothetical protein B7Z43_10975 [Sphingomonas sp. 12-62-6]|nr:MAG: hypothetical protein B7Z43_10975 [Sphingomonas sp. 12-62-6]OYY66241.1 MAG: hypothetical protein B7Y49_03395 [Sphingomonas sp. 28-62-11]
MDNSTIILLTLLFLVVLIPVLIWVFTSPEAPASYGDNARRTIEYIIALITVLFVLDCASDIPLRSDFVALIVGVTYLIIAVDWLMLAPDGRRAAL